MQHAAGHGFANQLDALLALLFLFFFFKASSCVVIGFFLRLFYLPMARLVQVSILTRQLEVTEEQRQRALERATQVFATS